MRSVLCSARDLVGLAAEVTTAGSAVRFCARGGSMAPTIVTGERVWVVPIDVSTLAPGDIVMVGGSRPVLHRVARIDHSRRLLVTRGDALEEEDEPTGLDSVVGRVVQVDRRWIVRAERLARSCWRRACCAVGGFSALESNGWRPTPPPTAGGRAGDRARPRP